MVSAVWWGGANAEHNRKDCIRGIAIGKIKEISKENNVVRRVKIEDAKTEIARFEAARDQGRRTERTLWQSGQRSRRGKCSHFWSAPDDVGGWRHSWFCPNIIEAQSVNAEFAVATTGDNFARMFADMDDDYEGTCSRCEGHLGACDPCFNAERRKGEHFWSRKKNIS